MFEMLTAVLTLAVQDGDVAAAAADATSSVAEAVPAAAAAPVIGGGMAFGIFVVGILGSFILGAIIAKSMRLTEWGFRFGVCLAALAIGVMPFAVRLINGQTLGQGLRLGIDLAGGTNMVFQVEEEEGKPLTDEVMDKMVGAVAKRINPTGTSEITVRQVGKDRIEVIVPGEDPQTVNDIKRRITKLGSLEFFITANPSVDDSNLIRQANELPLDQKQLVRTLADGTTEVYGMWLPAYEKGPRQEPQFLQRGDVVKRSVDKIRMVDGKPEKYTTEEYLVLVDPPEQQVSGKYLNQAGWGVDPQTGGQIVTFRFNTRGAFLFSRLTSRFQPQPGRPKRGLGIVLDRKLYSAPDINDVISENGQISGNFTVDEVRELAGVLNAGALEVPINPKPLSEATVDPTLGEDVRRKGVTAIMVAGALVVAFMLLYYQFAGIVAVLCLVLNLLLVLTIMMAIHATFTLPGLAGLVLTIGMAVDANVLIFERMREELNRGSSLRMSIQNGFNKAFTTIVDANVTTLITAIILYMIGTDQVKGFAVSLFIGIVVSMFTALYVGRLIFDIAERKGLVRKLRMFSLVGNTNWNFLGKKQLCMGASVLMIAIGLAAFAARGDQNYDIDFTGGTMVTFQLTEPAETEQVQQALAAQFPQNFTVERLTLAGEDESKGGRHFRLRTTESDTDENAGEATSAEDRVRHKVYEAFQQAPEMKLLMVNMDYSDIQPVTIADDDESAEALRYKRFNGGHSAEIKLSSEVAVGTISDMVSDAIAGIKSADGSKSRYPDPEALFGIQGINGSGLDAVGQQVQKFDEVRVRATSDLPQEDLEAALSAMKTHLDSSPLFDEVNTFASAVASEMKTSAVMAIIISLLAIVAYIWFRFQKITFGLAAVAALVHDVLFVLGLMALASSLNGTSIGNMLLVNDFRINLPIVAAFLTIVGYSLNDTIVVFDRIREVRGKNPGMTDEIINTSLNQTLSRTLLTSLTTLIVVAILYAIGGEGIHGFAFCLTMGVLVGTYSSIYIASPVLVWLMNRDTKTA